MEYRRLEERWEDAEKAGDMSRAIALIRDQIATNLVIVHNKFSDIQFCTQDEAFGYLTYSRVRKASEEDFVPFVLMDFRLIELGNYGECEVLEESILKEYAELEALLIEHMNMLEDDGSTAEAYDRQHARYLEHLNEQPCDDGKGGQDGENRIRAIIRTRNAQD